MKIKLIEIRDINDVLMKLGTKDLDISVAYKLSKILKLIQEELILLEENRIKMVKKYGAEDEKTKQIVVCPENIEAFRKDFSELLEIEIEIVFTPILLSQLVGATGKGITLKAVDVLILDGRIIVDDVIVDNIKKKKAE